jgi:integrase
MLDSGLAPSSVGRQHAALHRALEQAVRWDLVPRNVADLVDPPRPDHKEMHPLTPEEVGRFLEAAREYRLHALYVLAAATGMRQSELLGLTWPDVDLDAARLHEKAGLPRIRFHDLRHTAATLLLKQGTNPKVVQERLGRPTIAVTLDVYSHVLPDMQTEAAAKLDALLGGS